MPGGIYFNFVNGSLPGGSIGGDALMALYCRGSQTSYRGHRVGARRAVATVRRHSGFRQCRSWIHRCLVPVRRQGGRRPRGVGQRCLLVPRRPRAHIGASQPVAAIHAGRQTGPVRSGPGDLSGSRVRHLQHQLHRRRHWRHRHRSLGIHRGGRRGTGVVPHPPRRRSPGRRGDLHPQPRGPFRRRAGRHLTGRRRRRQGRGAGTAKASPSTRCRRTSTRERR